ncbi:MAG: sugar phosphate isomerase/epimerase [Thermoguttaceae bacterium]|nr:sugar phosphate isomerase/epimerase [Thermoguttaceae bacterium]MDW8077283.1 sugar phosphate isomerase/epimerase family protein [Thermoguttaceae bacterium]
MLLGYNTNGFAHHALVDAIEVLVAIGYRSVAITIDHHALNPFSADWERQLAAVGELLSRHQLCSVIETGARYLLNLWIKHEPTLVSSDPAGRERRLQFYFHAVRCAQALGSKCVSIWSGRRDPAVSGNLAWTWLVEGLHRLLDFAQRQGVKIALEPEPGMLVSTIDDYLLVVDKLGRDDLWLTVDFGHLHCQGEVPFARVLMPVKDRIVNVHIEDMRRGAHVHLPFGQGDLDVREAIATLEQFGYTGPVHVELSRNSDEAPSVAQEAYRFLCQLCKAGQ